MNENTTTPKSFYRQHTFENKGPKAAERKAYLHSLAVFLPHPQGSAPLSAAEISQRLFQERAARFPDQVRAEQQRRTELAMRKHRQQRELRAKR